MFHLIAVKVLASTGAREHVINYVRQVATIYRSYWMSKLCKPSKHFCNRQMVAMAGSTVVLLL